MYYDKASQVSSELKRLANVEISTHSQRFFKTGKGEYGEGDQFLGIRVPVLRSVAKIARLTLDEIHALLVSPWHEERLCALFILVENFSKARERIEERVQIYNFYLNHTAHINNWDLVDSSAHKIVGEYLFYQDDDQILFQLALSESLWERRIAVMATHYFIKRGKFDTTLKLSKMLLNDKNDLIHKIVGWMLREIGNIDVQTEMNFLDEYYHVMPRTMLRYAIEKFPEEKRQQYLSKPLKKT